MPVPQAVSVCASNESRQRPSRPAWLGWERWFCSAANLRRLSAIFSRSRGTRGGRGTRQSRPMGGVFTSDRAGGMTDIWVQDLRAAAALPYRLTSHPAADVSPAISPDGEWVAFRSGRDG